MDADGDRTEPVRGRRGTQADPEARRGTEADGAAPPSGEEDRTTPLARAEPRVLAGRYELRGLLGQGGMADVELAHDRVLDRQVAVKLLHTRYRDDPAFVTRFRREAQAAAGLNHANIVSVYDTGDADGRPFIVMEYVSGRSLRDVLRKEGVLPHRAAEIAGDAAAGLHYAHERDLVHRDVKPANIMVSDEGQVKVTDFGIARAVSAETITQTAATFGTAAYVSPEQAQGERVDRRSDVYSLGVVLYEMLTGHQPFTGETAVALAYKHVSESPKPPRERNPEISPQLEAVVMKALAKNPDNRYATARDFGDDLRRAAAGSAVSAPAVLPYAETQALTATPAPEETPAEEEPRRRRGLWVLLGLLLLAAIVGGALLLADLLTPTPLVEVPDVRGQSVAGAQNLLAAEGFEVRVAEEPVESTEYEEGLVAATDPEPGREAPQDTVVTLFLSAGPPTEVVPEVAGRPEADAEEILTEAGFGIGDRQTETSTDVDEGDVIRTEPPEGSEQPRGSDVSLVVSEGPPPVSVPNVINLTEDGARERLESEGLEVGSVGSAPSDEIPQGRVVASDPEVGTQVPPGTAVDLVLSEGLTTVTVPNVVRFPEEAAVTALEEACDEVPCLDVNVDNEFHDQVPEGQVISQDPEAGTSVDIGSAVTIVVSQGPEQPEEETPPDDDDDDDDDGDGEGNEGEQNTEDGQANQSNPSTQNPQGNQSNQGGPTTQTTGSNQGVPADPSNGGGNRGD